MSKVKKIKVPTAVTVILEKDQLSHIESLSYKMSVEHQRRVGVSELIRDAISKIYPIEKNKEQD